MTEKCGDNGDLYAGLNKKKNFERLQIPLMKYLFVFL